ncbi:MAG TPA: uracil-DNA glycosylase, partial [Spirochaetia bacterium]|nr:uracil-DNA glycosylase [Spirochaetia bacterium]
REAAPNKNNPPPQVEEKKKILDSIARQIMECTNCGLHKTRRKAVPGAGSLSPLVLIVGEGPGASEDASGKPFVGRAGKYLDKWLSAVKLETEMIPLNRSANAFITNIVKCRPPQNRDPGTEEAVACFPYLEKQIEVLKPRSILTVGRIAAKLLTGSSSGIGSLRGQVYHYGKIPLVPTYHPSAVLRDPSLRRAVWQDLKLLKSVLEHHELR